MPESKAEKLRYSMQGAIMISRNCQDWAAQNGHADDLAAIHRLRDAWRAAKPKIDPLFALNTEQLTVRREKAKAALARIDLALAVKS